MIKRLLVVNRAEIACRIMRTAKLMGIKTVALFTEVDQDAKHVADADFTELLQGGPTQGYLDVVEVLAAAKRSGADAVHPGYGFLSESPKFTESCAAQGLVFVGPPVAAMRQASSKTHARTAAVKAKIPVLEGFDTSGVTATKVRAAGARIGYPLLVKAADGGGGRGIRAVASPDDLKSAVAQAQREAKSAFGNNATVFLERQLADARHIEVQVLADAYGTVAVLGDRDCSLQRRRQKVVEEAPAPSLSKKLREMLHEDASRLAREIGYVNAGTVEFLVAGNEYYFLEVNARLQVEHPVTEMTCGLDLVEWQLRVAAGERLPSHFVSAPHGHAIELRICAEVPEREFVPATGKISTMNWMAGQGIRVDTGVRTGDTVGGQFDSLVAKLVVHSPIGRTDCLSKLATALGNFELAGIESNLAYLATIVELNEMRRAKTRIDTLDRHIATLVRQARGKLMMARALACVARSVLRGADELTGFRVNLPRQTRLVLDDEVASLAVSIQHATDGTLTLGGLGKQEVLVRNPQIAGKKVSAEINGISCQAQVLRDSGKRLVLNHGGTAFAFGFSTEAPPTQTGRTVTDATVAAEIRAPMHGTIMAWKVRRGQKVAKDELLLLLEAMKMEIEIRAPRSGIVAELDVAVGNQVAAGDVLATYAKK